MKGFKLNMSDKAISGAVKRGFTSVMISNKDGFYKLDFGSVDDEGNFYTWYNINLQYGDSFNIYYDEISEVSSTNNIRNISNAEEENELAIKLYHKLKQELIEEGLL